MAFKASNILPQEAYQTVKRAAVQLKVNLASFNTRLAGSSADYDFLRDIYQTLARADSQFTSLRSTQGLADFARVQEGDPSYDVAAEFVGMQAAIAVALSWLDANIPTNVELKTPFNWSDGTMVSTTFNVTQTAGLRTEIDAILATIA